MNDLLRCAALLTAISTPLLYAADTGPGLCLECHDYGEDSPVHQVLAGAHGVGLEPGDPDDRRACLDCHGSSEPHTRAPRRNSPDVSFGPRWSSSAGDQDKACLGCHEDNTAINWRHALHMHNNITCVTCHDLHQAEDRVQFAEQQAQVCSVCHKREKQGIHGLQHLSPQNPPCSECHNPHNHESAELEMQANRSSGCVSCHDLGAMASDSTVSPKAVSYHKVMSNPARTCLDCHDGIAHAPADSAPPLQRVAVASREITLFYPGITDSTWLLQQHPGSQPLRQGANCQQCHRGEESAMGEALAEGSINPPARALTVSVSRSDDELKLVLTWAGDEQDRTLSLMWGDHSDPGFARGACFAACHDDMAGMSGDRGQVAQKYLAISRQQRSRVGQPAVVKSDEKLQELIEAGRFAEIWRLDLDSGELTTAQLLSGARFEPTNLIRINKTYQSGQWRVELRRQMNNTQAGLTITTDRRYTFGMALNGATGSGANHWVSLPLTLSFGGTDTDLTAE